MGFSIRSRGADFVGNDQSVLATEFFDNSRRSIAHESGVVDLSTKAGPIGDDVHVVDVFCGAYSMVGGDENGCDYDPLPQAPKAGGASAVCGNKLTSCITVVTLRYIPYNVSYNHSLLCIQALAACLARKSIVDSLMHLRTRITAFATPRSPNRRTTKSARS